MAVKDVVLAAGAIVARWVGHLVDQRLQKQMEPPMRLLIVRALKIVVMLFAVVVALDKFGFQIAPLVAGIGVAGLGVGDVSKIELFSTTLLHPDRSRVVIPNRRIVGEILHNYGSMRQRDLAVAVPHDADLTKVLAAIGDVVSRNARVLKDPAPAIGIAQVTESSIKIAIQPWVRIVDVGAAEAEIYGALLQEFRARHIELGLARQEVRLVNA